MGARIQLVFGAACVTLAVLCAPALDVASRRATEAQGRLLDAAGFCVALLMVLGAVLVLVALARISGGRR